MTSSSQFPRLARAFEMPEDPHESPEVEAFLDRFAELAAQEKARVAEIRRETHAAEVEILRDLAALRASGAVTEQDLARLYTRLRPRARSGIGGRWDSIIDFKRVDIERLHFADPQPDGRWRGPWPLLWDTTAPRAGQAVVYYLYDDQSVTCYIGSTGDLRTRLRTHASTGKVFESWMAEPYPTRKAAYVAEERILRSGPLPRYNRE